MNKKFTKLMAALALLVFMAPNMVGWGQSTYTKVTTTPTDWTGTYVIVADASNVIFTGQNGSYNYGGYVAVTISNGSVTGDFTNYEVEIAASGDYYSIKHTSSSKYLGLTSDGNNLHFSTSTPSANTYRWSLSTSKIVPASYTARNLQYNNANNSQRFACYKGTQQDAFLYKKEVSTTTPTTVTIDATGITNTDIYAGTAAGSLSATVTVTEGGAAVSDATVTWASSDPTVAIIDQNGTVTLVAAGTTNITATYAGNATYSSSSATYNLEVIDNTPATTITIDATGITNTDVYVSTAAGSLSATVTSGGSTVSGATVTWSGDNDAVATIASDGTVTLVGAGTVNFTATYAGAAGQYMPSSATYEMIVTSSSPEIEIEIDLNNTFFGCEAFTSWTSDYETSYNGTKDGVTITLDKADGQYMYINDNGIRMYDGNTLTFDAPDGYTIIQIELEGASGFSANLEADGLEDGTWTGSATQVVITGNTNKKNMTKATVTLAPIGTEPFITVASNLIEVDYNGGEGTLDITYENLPIEDMTDFYIQYYDAEGVETEKPNWIDELLVAEQDPSIGEGYVVSYVVTENEDNARSAYFKVYALDEEAELVYSNLVTINQAGVVLYGYSNNGVIGNISLAGQGTTITLAVGTNLNGTFVFAGWTTDPNDVSELLTSYTFPNDDTPVTFYAVYTKATSGTRTAANYVKVTSTDDLEDGDYLIVYEEGGVAFDGSRDKTESPKLDDTNNTISVFDYLNDGVIASNETTDAAVFTIAAIDGGYSIQSASGYYIGKTANSNGLDVNASTKYTNTLTINEDGNAVITASGGCTMKYNAASDQNRFRYYKSGQKDIQLYKKQGGSAPTPVVLPTYFTRVFLNETVEDDIEITGPSIIPSGSVLDMGEDYVLTNDLGVTRLVIEDGGQLYSVLGVDATAQKNITGRENGGGWNFITSPIFAVEMDPAAAGMTTGNYDLYRFNPSVEPAANGNTYEWENYKSHGFTVEGGHGYLYANLNDVVLQFSGVVNNEETVVSFDYDPESASEWKEWHLVGNPYMYEAYADRDYYVIDNGQIVSSVNTVPVAPCEGIMIQGTDDGIIEFTKDEPTDEGRLQMTVAKQVVMRDGVSTGSTTIDNAIVSFNEGSRLGKFYFGENDANIYIPQNGKEYAIVSAEAQGEMPVNFRATKNGTYTLTINPEGVEMNYLHLIDNMTGANIDLLQTPSYTFNASMNDYESRFKLVFAAGSSTGSEASETFAFFANGELIVNNEGEATLQVVDMTGRILSSQSLNGNGSVQMAAPVGVYVLRLISGNEVKTQKIVVR